jgi:iron complex outermembrane receptor protein
MWGSALEWRPLDGHLLYIGIDRGFKSGGFQLGGVGEYGPEHIWAYKAGTKSEFLDGMLQVNLEGFFYNYDDMQIALIDGLQTRTESANTRMYGVELEANAEPIEGLRLGAVIGHLNTEVLEYASLDPATLGNTFIDDLLAKRTTAEQLGTRYENQSCFNPQTRRQVPCGQLNTTVRGEVIENGYVNFSGNELSRAPEWKVTLSAEYEFPIGRFGSLTPRIHYAWQDDTYFRVFNRDYDLQEAYHRTDAKVLWNSPEERWTAELFVENIEDEDDTSYVLVGSRVFNSPLLAWYNTPRFYGFRVGFKY